MFISRGQTAPSGQSFDVNRYVLSLHSFVASLKKGNVYWQRVVNSDFAIDNRLSIAIDNRYSLDVI